MKWTDFFNIALFAFLWVMLIEKKSGLKKWILDVTNDQLILGIVVPVIVYAAIVIAGRIMKNKYLNAE
ncbi:MULTISPECIES: hypothetical protein [Fictibacillus]|jgi:hypothetical protein|uniref:hypothetical protein n=1 Tax=Fictibacillus TaxID=1329200 RepID=UPI0018CDC72E|nr:MULTISPECIES: hypothetical protein [unclassified Fictibacillus]MBH0159714.1 hypothetical protein [Fictibacillus sp. 26RED30]MBH0163494.1 hypothetical protein [Fictibacillus sp. 7GRE50]